MTSQWCLMPNNVNKPVSYLVPMSERASIDVSSAFEDSNLRKMKGLMPSALVEAGGKQKILYVQSVFDKIAFGGMSVWFLLVAILICVILFSKTLNRR